MMIELIYFLHNNTLLAAILMVSHKLTQIYKYTNNIHAQFSRYMLFYMKPDLISDIYFWYYRPSIIDPYNFIYVSTSLAFTVNIYSGLYDLEMIHDNFLVKSNE